MRHKLSHILLLIICGVLLFLQPKTSTAQEMRIIYPKVASGSDTFICYYWTLLDEALLRTNVEYGPAKVTQTKDVMNHLRAMEELKSGNISLYLRAFIPEELIDDIELVPFPLDKGLLGHRIALIHHESQEQISQIKSFDDLRRFAIGQDAVWLDAKIMEAAGLKVVLSSNYDGLFPMLNSRRIDLFTRGANEVLGELRVKQEEFPDLRIEETLLISYQMSFYFLVKKDATGQRIKERLVLGLERMVEDGSFDRYYSDLKRIAFEGIGMQNRRVIQIPNHFYSRPEYLTDRASAWDDLSLELGNK